MSKHNNNTSPSLAARCRCGRCITIGEEYGGVNTVGYECPNCFRRRHSKPLTREEYYEQFKR
jgi:hypothetical protein